MIVFPNCKINLGLQIIRKRDDGYHDIDSVLYPINWCDILEAVPDHDFTISYSGMKIPVEGGNIIEKAVRILQKDHPLVKPKMHLHKIIPMGAGLGGGSSDGAFTLKLLNDLYELKLTNHQLEKYAAQLGADCAFFIRNQPAYLLGRGEELSIFNPDMSSYKILLIHPGIHISTSKAFASVTPHAGRKTTRTIITEYSIEEWKNHLENDFENYAISAYPELLQLKEKIYASGAIYASMSGSGSCFYGIFDKHAEIDLSVFEKLNYNCKITG